jgi:hypothetical protein
MIDEADPVATPRPRPGALERTLHWSWPRSFAIVQFPNLPLAVALVADAAARFSGDGTQRSLRAVFYLGLGVWAYDEMRHGANCFRRGLGAGFSIYLIAELATSLRP